MDTPAMREFINGYVGCSLWSSGELFDGLELAPEAMEKLEAFARSFAIENADMLSQAKCVEGYTWEQAGVDLWLTQAMQAAGYWDGDLPEEIGQALTDAATAFCEYILYIGDDGLVYIG